MNRLPDTPPGRIVLLNGTSSSGKSSIAAELLSVLGDPHFHMSLDAFYGMRARTGPSLSDPTPDEVVYRRVHSGFHRAVAGMADAGNHVVVDEVVRRPWQLPDALTVWKGHDVTFVGVHCPADELARRERERGDRQVGQAAGQFPFVHAHGVYDVECDTSLHGPGECARIIKAHLDAPPATTAFDRLREAGWDVER